MHHEFPNQFAKYQANSNDFIIIKYQDITNNLIKHAPNFCDRHRGIGADGILVLNPDNNILTMHVINQDGSLAQNCGNGLRCAAQWYFDNNIHESRIFISLASKIYECQKIGEQILVSMGDAELEYLGLKLSCEIPCYKISLGNNHLVFILENNNLDINLLLKQTQEHISNWQDYNINFVIKNNNYYYSQVFERGVGFTKSCGSGACAAAAALYMSNMHEQDFEHDINIVQPGGSILVSVRMLESHANRARFMVKQKGPAQKVFMGVL